MNPTIGVTWSTGSMNYKGIQPINSRWKKQNKIIIHALEINLEHIVFLLMTNGVMRGLPNCLSTYLSVLGTLLLPFGCAHTHCFGLFTELQSSKPDRQERLDLYSSGPHTTWRKGERARIYEDMLAYPGEHCLVNKCTSRLTRPGFTFLRCPDPAN